MSHRSPAVKVISSSIIELETMGRETPARLAQGIEAAFRRLHELMAALVGHVGFDAVLRRAIHLTQPACPWVSDDLIEFGPTLTMKTLPEMIEREGAAAVSACAAELMAHVIGLLCTFIGEDLTFRLIRRAWKELPGGAGSRSEES